MWSSRADHSRKRRSPTARQVVGELLAAEPRAARRRPTRCARSRRARRARRRPGSRPRARPSTRAPDARRPAPDRVPRVVAGGLVDERRRRRRARHVARRRRARARAPCTGACLRVQMYERPCGETTSTPGAPRRARGRARRARARAGRQLDAAAPALEQRAVRQRHGPPALRHARDARVAHAQHQVRPVDGRRSASASAGVRARSGGIRVGAAGGRAELAHARRRDGQVAHRVRSTLQIDWSVNRPGEDVRARRRRPAQLDERQGSQPRGGGAPHARRRRRRRRAGRAARSGSTSAAAHATTLAGAEPLDGRPIALGARDSRASSASTSSPARSPSAARATTASSNTSVHVGPDGEIKAVYRKIHMFDVEVGGRRVPRVRALRAGGRDRALRDRRRRPARPDHLLRPALPRAVPDPRAARRAHRHGAGQLHARSPARPTGRCCCAPARSRTRCS